MAIVCLIIFILAIRAAIRARKRKPRKASAAPVEYTRPPDIAAKLAALDSLQAARRTTEETISYIDGLFLDPELPMKEKDVLYWLKQKAAAEKQLAGIEKQIQNLIK